MTNVLTCQRVWTRTWRHSLLTASVLAIAASAPAQAVVFNGQTFPDGFTNDAPVTEQGTAIEFRNSTIQNGLINTANGIVEGTNDTALLFSGGTVLEGGGLNLGELRGGQFGVRFTSNTSVTGGFRNGNLIQAGFIGDLPPAPIGSPITGNGTLFGGLGGDNGFGEISVPRNDDGFTSYDISSVAPDGLNFFGNVFTEIFVNTNGNITLGNGLSTFTPFAITGATGTRLIAPFFADVDTRQPASLGAESQPVYVDLDPVTGVISITWPGVNYYSTNGDKQNLFQLQLFDRGNGNFDIVYRYQDIQWTTGDASGGTGGLGGTIARAGYSAGDAVNFFELPASGIQDAILDLENQLGNTGVIGLWVFQVRNGVVADPENGAAFYSQAASWEGGFDNQTAGRIEGQAAGVLMKGQTYSGPWTNAGAIEGGLGENGFGRRVGVELDFDTWAGNFYNSATGSIKGGITGTIIRARTSFTGNAGNAGVIEGFGQATGWHIIAGLLDGSITNDPAGIVRAPSNALHLEINRLTGAVSNQGLIEATDPDGIAVLLQGLTVNEGEEGDGEEGGGDECGECEFAAAATPGGPAGSLAQIQEGLPEGVYEQGLTNSGRIKTGPQGTAIKIEASVLGPIRNSGEIEGLIAIDNTLAPTPLTFVQTGGSTVGDILFGDPAGSARFEGGRFLGSFIGTGNDRVEIAGGANIVSLIGGAEGLASFTALNGQTVLGSTAPDSNSPGFQGFGLGAITFNAQTFLSSHTVLTGSSLTLGENSVLSYFLTGDSSVAPSIGVSGDAALDGIFRVFLDPTALAVLAEGELVVENVLSAGAFTGAFDALTYAGTNQILRMALVIEEGGASLTGGEVQALAVADATIAATLFANLIITPFEFASVGDPTGFGEVLDRVYQSEDLALDLRDVLLFIGLDDLTQVQERIAQLQGRENAENPNILPNTTNNFNKDTSDRTDALLNQNASGGGCTTTVSLGNWGCFRRYAQADTPLPSDAVATDADPFAWLDTGGLRDPGRTAVWGRVFGILGERHESIFAPGSDQQSGGFIAGVDHTFDKRFMAGLSFQLSKSHIDYDRSVNKADIDAFQFGGYFSYGDPDLYVTGILSGIFSEYETYRRVAIGPFLFEPRAEYDSDAVSGQLEVAKLMEVGGLMFQPTIALSYNQQWVDGFRETGAGGVGLIVQADETQSLRSILGARLGIPLDFGTVTVVPVLSVSWAHEFLDTRQIIDAAFIGAPGVPFIIQGSPVGRDTATLGTGFSIPLGERTTLYADYSFALNEAFQTHTGSAGIRVSW